MKKHLLFFLLFLSLYGCSGSRFLQDKILLEIKSKPSDDNQTVYFKKKCEVDTDGQLVVSTHKVVKLPKDVKLRPEGVAFYLNSTDELDYFYARLINKDGSTENYDKGNLYSHNTSSGGAVTEATLYSLPIKDKNHEGDFLELVYAQNIAFSSLGFSFSLDEAGEKADNIYCEISVPDNYRLNYATLNDSLKPSSLAGEKKTSFSFFWKSFEDKHNDKSNPFQKLNIYPGVIASFSRKDQPENTTNPWKEFGNWYLELVKDKLKPGAEIKALSENLTNGLTDPKEKLNAIFNYCQKNIRYEQLYLQGGEFIPNDCSLILTRKFGDCKDYSAIIYTLAKCAGVDANLALCFRGRGVEFYNIPANQFNHAVVHYSYKGKDYWYDATNRISEPGLTTFDLANQMALVIEKDNSRIIKIIENEGNLLSVSGTLKENGDSFLTNLKLSFEKQYAIDFLYADIFLNRSDMRNFLSEWLKNNLCRNLAILDMKWTVGDNGAFEILLKAKMPNSFTKISSTYYTGIRKIFPELLPDYSITKNDGLFFFPKFNHVNINLQLPEMQNAASEENASLKYSYWLPIGPFLNEIDKKDFTDMYNGILSDLNKKVKLIKRTAQ